MIRGDRESGLPWLSGYELDIDGAGDSGLGHVHFPCHPQPGPGELRFEVGDWHHLRVEAMGPEFRVVLDGEDSLSFADDRYRYGQILLEGERDGVTYRNLHLQVLDKEPPAGLRSPWRDLFDGHTVSGWLPPGDRVRVRGGNLVLDAREQPVVVQTANALPADGMYEIDVWRHGTEEEAGSYGLSMRGDLSGGASGVSFRCEPGRITARDVRPPATAATELVPTKWPEYWRFVLNGGQVSAHRFGEEVLSFQDPDSRAGPLTITARNCRLEVRGVRYRPLSDAGEPAGD